MAPAPLARGKKAYQQHPLDNITGVRHEAVRLTALDTPQRPCDPAEAVDPNKDVEKPVDKVKRGKTLEITINLLIQQTRCALMLNQSLRNAE